MRKDPDALGLEPAPHARNYRWTRWIELVASIAVYGLVVPYRPFAHLFGFVSFEERHGEWPEVLLLGAVLIGLQATYGRLFRRSELLAELEAAKSQLRQGHLKRLPFSVRFAFLVCMLSLVSLGWYARESHGSRILAIAVPLFLLFAAMEFVAVIRPGDSFLPDPHDELLQFFRIRMLEVGYVTAILALMGLYLISLWGTTYVGVLLPYVLTISLLSPAFIYHRLNRQAGPDE